MKSQDILILLKLASLRQQAEHGSAMERADAYSVRSLADDLGIGKSEVGYSINRSLESGLAIRDRGDQHPKPNQKALFEFIVFGLKYVFPAKPGPLARGIATSFSAPVLSDKLISAGDSKYVWPHAEGNVSGQSVEPLFKSVHKAIEHDEHLYEYLALVDAVRLGNAREVGIAKEELQMRLRHS